MTLNELCYKFGTDKGDTQYLRRAPKNYTDGYERIFGPIRGRVQRVLELGIAHGGSLLVWQAYFHQAAIWGVDIVACPRVEGADRIYTLVGDMRDPLTYKSWPEPSKDFQFDIVIDDASHKASDSSIAMAVLWPWLRVGGYYAVEDLHADERYADFIETRRDKQIAHLEPSLVIFRK